MADPTEKLLALTGFDPVKQPKVTAEIFKEVLSDIQKERGEKAKAKARELIVKAIELREQMVKAEREFNQQKAKFEKELGKILSQLERDMSQSQAAGEPQAEEEPQVEEEEHRE